MTTSYGIFDGDGRTRVEPVNAPPCTYPVSITRSQARMLIDRFVARGESNHSSQGNTVWVLWTYCLQHNIPFEYYYSSNLGIYIRKRSTL